MASFHNDEPIALSKVLCFPPHDLAALVDDGERVIVRRTNPETEFRLNGEYLRRSIVLRDEGVRKTRSIEDPIASEVFAERRAVQKTSEGLESIRCSEETVDGDASSLLDRLCSRIKNLHEGYGAGGDAHRRLHKVALRPQSGERKSSSSARLVDQSLLLQRLENTDEAVVHGEDETGREQLQLEPRVHERRAVRQELEVRHDTVEPPCGLLDLGLVCTINPLRLRQVPSDAPEELFRRFDYAALVVLLQVALLQDAARVVRQLRIGLMLDNLDSLRISNSHLFHGTTSPEGHGGHAT